MPQYMLLMYTPAEQDEYQREVAASGDWSKEMAAEHKRWSAYLQELKDAGVYLANNGLQGVEAATTVRVRDGETQVTDGPFVETKEMLAGYFLIEVADLDEALTYAARIPSAEYGSVEVRPVWG